MENVNIENFTEDDWRNISIYQNLSEKFIEKYSDKLNWELISTHQKLSENFIDKYVNKLAWCEISKHQRLSENFIEKYANKINWYWISEYQNLSEEFIEKHSNQVNWMNISICQHLSEEFIERHVDDVNWYYISVYQKLSEEFIEKYSDRISWGNISKYQVISKSFAKKHNIFIKNNGHRAVHKWKKIIKNTKKYECHKNYFYAYKGIRNDRYSRFNFQYQYLPGKTYECFSDYSNEENSFGLSAWTEESAKVYCSELVVKVKIYYRDVTAVVHNNNKIRCKRLTVMN